MILIRYWYLVVILTLATVLGVYINQNKKLRDDNTRQKENFEQINNESIQVFILKNEEYRKMNTRWRQQMDSVMADHRIKLRNVQNATVINTVYRDTGTTKVIYKDVIQLPDRSYRIPIESNTDCWGLKGYINSLDQNSQLEITERTANDLIHIFVLRKRFLGFLWHTKKTEYKAYGQCGDLKVTSVSFTR